MYNYCVTRLRYVVDNYILYVVYYYILSTSSELTEVLGKYDSLIIAVRKTNGCVYACLQTGSLSRHKPLTSLRKCL